MQNAHWSWIFWFNVPIGLVAIAGLQLFLHERPVQREAELDLVSAGLLFAATSAMMLLFTQGPSWGWMPSGAGAASAGGGARFFASVAGTGTPHQLRDLSDKLLLLANP